MSMSRDKHSYTCAAPQAFSTHVPSQDDLYAEGLQHLRNFGQTLAHGFHDWHGHMMHAASNHAEDAQNHAAEAQFHAAHAHDAHSAASSRKSGGLEAMQSSLRKMDESLNKLQSILHEMQHGSEQPQWPSHSSHNAPVQSERLPRKSLYANNLPGLSAHRRVYSAAGDGRSHVDGLHYLRVHDLLPQSPDSRESER